MTFRRSSGIGIVISTLAVSGCMSGHTAPPSAQQQAASGEVGAAFLEWTGRFTPTLTATKSISGSGRIAATGDIRLTAYDQNILRAQINFSVDQSPPINDNYKWSLSSGECRSNTIPLLPVSEFPPIAIVSNRGSLDTKVSLPLPTSGRYHVNIFWTDGVDESDVMACADLKLQRRVPESR